jgi:serine/threonine protein kinase
VEADFWSLGIILFEMVYSHRPFSKHCPRQAIRFIDDLYQQQIFLTSTSFNQPHGQVRAKPTVKPSKKSEPTVSLSDAPCMCAADEEEEMIFASSSAIMSTPPVTPINETLTMVAPPAEEQQEFEVPMAEPTRRDVVDSIIKHNRHLRKTFLNLETVARRDLKSAAPPSLSSSQDMEAPITCLTRGGQIHTLFEVRSKIPVNLRPCIPPSSKSAGIISNNCIDVIEGLLDVRLWHRLGAGENYSTLQNHPWFCSPSVGFGCWEQVLEKRLVAPFSPQGTDVATHLCNKFLHLPGEDAAVTTAPDDEKEDTGGAFS